MPALALATRGTATRLILVRHAEPVAELRGRVYGRTDAGLSPDGTAHAQRLGRELAGAGLDVVIASPRRRAVDTARPIAAAHDLPVELEPDLAELDFGAFEGRPYDEIARTHPAFWEQWMAAPTTVQFPGGERHADLKARVDRAVGELRVRRARQTSLVVSHGGVIRTILATTLGLPDAAIFRFDQRYGAINVVDWFEDEPVVRLLNG